MKRFLLIFFCLIAGVAKAQQDAQYSQYIFNGLFINPAYAGYKHDLYIQSFYRSQWTGLEGAPKSFTVSADAAVNNDRVGLAILIAQDKIGAQSTTAGYANYSYRLQVGEDEDSRLSFGIGGGFVQAGIDGTQLHAAHDADNAIPLTNQSVLLPDARLGVMYTNNDFFVGFSADNLLAQHIKTDNSLLVPIPKPHYYFTAGALVDITDGAKFKPSILIKDDAAGPTSLDVNAFLLLGEKVWVGSTYRTAIPLYAKPHLQTTLQKSNSITGMAEFFASENIRVGYAFDYSLTSVGTSTYGTHEFSIGFFLRSPHRDTRQNGYKCYF
jgi:type IX secretion system PorP/SprF family membrane protein